MNSQERNILNSNSYPRPSGTEPEDRCLGLMSEIQPLSPRERDCLAMLANGFRIITIAHKLTLARVTVELYLHNAKRKLKARTLHEAVARGILLRKI